MFLWRAYPSPAGEVLDRLVVTVNGHALLQSDWDDEVRYECFMSGRPLQDVTAEDRKAALDRLIDQELLREQMRSADFKAVSPSEVDKQMDVIKADYARDHESQSWNAALSAYGLTEAIARAHLALELNQLRVVDSHLRSTVQIDPAEVESYYQKQVLPKFSGAKPVSLQQATPQIRELLIQQKINDLLSSWLETLRSQAQLKILVNVAPKSGPQ
jgi:hypothetical protein